jgi:hypothetical protein
VASTGKTGFGFFQKRTHQRAVVLTDCTSDRPRAAGSVNHFRDGSSYKTNEHMPQLFGKTWADCLVAISWSSSSSNSTRWRDTLALELKVYAQHNPSTLKTNDQ